MSSIPRKTCNCHTVEGLHTPDCPLYDGNDAMCELCGEPMSENEQMFKYHGYSGPCPKPPAPLSPIALDFEAARRQATIDIHECPDVGFEECVQHQLNAQLRALVARVAQEEREKWEARIKELEGHRIELVTDRARLILGDHQWNQMPLEERDVLVALRVAEYNTRAIRGRELQAEQPYRSSLRGTP